MKTLTYLILLLISIFIFSSCIVINSSGYNRLSSLEKSKITNFTENIPTKDTKDTFFIQTVHSSDILKLSEKYKNVWIHSFVPSCSQLNIQAIDDLLKLENEDKNLKVILISVTADFGNLEYLSKASKAKHFYILSPSAYSPNATKSEKMFFNELKTNFEHATTKEKRYSDYIISDNKTLKWRNREVGFQDFFNDFRQMQNNNL